jgi:LacI family transcriptional regulator
MTVSRVTNGQDGVSPQTAARVRQVIKTLGYHRNELADQLRRGRSNATLGLVVDDISNPFYATLARAVEEEAHRHGHLVLAGSTNEEPGREHQLIASLCERRVGGFIVVPVSAPHDLLRTQRDLGTPLVVVDRPSDGLDADAVLIDNQGGEGQAIGHLTRQGHTRIAYLGDADRIWTARQRHEGYRRALGQAGIDYDTALARVLALHRHELEDHVSPPTDGGAPRRRHRASQSHLSARMPSGRVDRVSRGRVR